MLLQWAPNVLVLVPKAAVHEDHPPSAPKHDIRTAGHLAISYASEDIDLARSIYDQLYTQSKIFFAPAERAYLWGQDLNKALPNTYGVDSRFVLVLSSNSYVKKYWTKLEFSAALKTLGDGRLMVVKLDALPPEMPPDIVMVNANPANLVSLIETIKFKISCTPAI